MRTRVILAVVGTLLGVTSTGAWAQGDSAQCDIKTSHFAVTRAVLYIQNASNEQDSVKRQLALDGAYRSLVEALQSGGEVDPNMWYFLGIYYAMRGDGFGADSAFDKVERALPGCKNDIAQYRQNVWAQVVNRGIEGLREGDNEKAKAQFRLGNELHMGDPTASFYLGTVFATEDNADSALHYYKVAAQVAQGDTANAEIREKSVQNVARIYQVVEDHDSAAVWFREYRKIRPDDPEGLTGHASSLLATGDTAAAVALYDSILSRVERLTRRADSLREAGDTLGAGALSDSIMNPLDLFRVGVSLFRTDRADYAARAFELGLKRNPYYRNGLFNLTNAYFQLAQTAQERNQAAAVREHARKMVDSGRRLLGVDPRNAQVIRLVAAGYQLLARDDSTDIWLKRANELTWEVDVPVARETTGGYEVQGTIRPIPPTRIHALRDSITRDSTRLETVRQSIQTGTDPQTGRAIPASQRTLLTQRQTTLQRRLAGLRAELQRLQAPVSVPAITFEFLNAQGEVVASETVAAQSIAPNAPKEFQLTVTGEGIVAWRYKVQ